VSTGDAVRLADRVVLGPATDADAGEVLTLQRAAFVREAIAYRHPDLPPLTETLDDVRAAIASQVVLIGRLGSRAVATGRVRVLDRVGHVGRLAVAPDLQGRGIGRRLLAALEAACRGRVDAFELFTGERTQENLHLYRSAGYRDVRRQLLAEGYGLIHLRKEAEPGGTAPDTASDPIAERLLPGVWRLERWESVAEDGSLTLPMGVRVEGILVYTPGGSMVTAIAPEERPLLSSADPLRGGPPDERLGAAETFIAYAGGYRIRDHDVIHEVTLSLYPNWVGTRQVRHIGSLDERTLVLSTDPFTLDGRRAVQRLTWVRSDDA
jgi:ribosomal protein S18 acetylase RimI-like enzyme